jgi:hypothetical protein
MDPEVLQVVLSLPILPAVKRGSVTGFSMKMWDMYPTIIRGGAGRCQEPRGQSKTLLTLQDLRNMRVRCILGAHAMLY